MFGSGEHLRHHPPGSSPVDIPPPCPMLMLESSTERQWILLWPHKPVFSQHFCLSCERRTILSRTKAGRVAVSWRSTSSFTDRVSKLEKKEKNPPNQHKQNSRTGDKKISSLHFIFSYSLSHPFRASAVADSCQSRGWRYKRATCPTEGEFDSLLRTTASLRLEKTSKITKSNHQLCTTTMFPIKPCPQVP